MMTKPTTSISSISRSDTNKNATPPQLARSTTRSMCSMPWPVPWRTVRRCSLPHAPRLGITAAVTAAAKRRTTVARPSRRTATCGASTSLRASAAAAPRCRLNMAPSLHHHHLRRCLARRRRSLAKSFRRIKPSTLSVPLPRRLRRGHHPPRTPRRPIAQLPLTTPTCHRRPASPSEQCTATARVTRDLLATQPPRLELARHRLRATAQTALPRFASCARPQCCITAT